MQVGAQLHLHNTVVAEKKYIVTWALTPAATLATAVRANRRPILHVYV